MNRYPDNTRAILITDVNGSGDDVMVFTSLPPEVLEAAYATTEITWAEFYEVPAKDLAYYLYEPCWLTLEEEARARELATKLRPSAATDGATRAA
jgi:hypothetical protein